MGIKLRELVELLEPRICGGRTVLKSLPLDGETLVRYGPFDKDAKMFLTVNCPSGDWYVARVGRNSIDWEEGRFDLALLDRTVTKIKYMDDQRLEVTVDGRVGRGQEDR